MAERRGMGRGLAAILAVSDGERDGDRAAGAPGRADRAEPVAAPPALRRGGARTRSPTRCASAACCSPSSCARAPADATSWSPASAAGAPPSWPGSRRSRRSCSARDDAQTLELALIENMAREDLNPVEEARAVAALVEELGLTREEVGRRVGRSRVAVSNLLRLLDLPDEVLDAARGGRADRGPRPRAAARRRPRCPPVAWRATPPPRAGRCGCSRRAPRGRRGRRRRAGRRAAVHPDQAAAAEEIADALAGALGREVTRAAARHRLQGGAGLRRPRRGAGARAARAAPPPGPERALHCPLSAGD